MWMDACRTSILLPEHTQICQRPNGIAQGTWIYATFLRFFFDKYMLITILFLKLNWNAYHVAGHLYWAWKKRSTYWDGKKKVLMKKKHLNFFIHHSRVVKMILNHNGTCLKECSPCRTYCMCLKRKLTLCNMHSPSK